MSSSRRDGLISLVPVRLYLAYQDPRNRIIPSRRDGTSFSNLSQAVNCQATIDQSLRDKNTRALRLTPMRSRGLRWQAAVDSWSVPSTDRDRMNPGTRRSGQAQRSDDQ